ncbi:MAG: aldehyde dehydrogenase family protein [Verrucomicrobia bacterium]|nr:aldehyde dehydrogenase family protein [Verrucomicrobiota bacterium]
MNATIAQHIQPERDVLADARAAQSRWSQTPIRERLRIVRALRHLIAENADKLASIAASVSDRPIAEKLVSEVLPLADACRWLEKSADRVLATRRCGSRGRPFWMQGVTFEVQRQPFGLVLVIGPGNYPLFLPAVHALHALVAGNAVLLKPAPGTRHVALAFAQVARDAGLDPALLTILPESVQAARNVIEDGVDKVIFTGSSENGRDVLATLAETNTPSVMELSGQDAVLVFADADLDLVVRALRFGTSLNDGETCIAPRRLVVVQSVAEDLLMRLAVAQVPRMLIERVRDKETAVLRANDADFALGCSIFSRDVAKARALAARIKTGFVLINDLIAPTADPRMPFGGVKASGFGTTRGDEGLLEMTFPHVVAERHGRAHPHFDEPAAGDAHLFSAYIRAAHGTRRFAAFRDLFRALLAKFKTRKTRP